MNGPVIVESSGVTVECALEDRLVPAALRALLGATPLDLEVDRRAVPTRPAWLALVVHVLRWYRVRLSPHLGQRCVFDPSCSRYAELALTKRGLIRGIWLIIHRLWRCRPNAGGVDLP